MINAVVIDDELAMKSIIKYFIARDHLPIDIVGHASNGIDAIELIEKTDPLLVFLDIKMPGLNGFEVMERLPGYNYIIITAYSFFEYAQQGLRLGAKDILLKPIEHDQFSKALTRALGWQFTNNGLVNSVLEYVHLKFCEQINLATISGIVHATPDHVSRLFRKHVGCTINDYINRLRIDRSVVLLETSSKTIQDISEAVGFGSIKHFYSCFKKFKSITPGDYRKRVKV